MQFRIIDKDDPAGPVEQWKIERYFSDHELDLDEIFISLKDLSDAKTIQIAKRLLKKLERTER